MEIQAVIGQFEKELRNAVAFRYRHEREDHKQIMLRTHLVNSFDLSRFVAEYENAKVYPMNRLEKLVYLLIDIKLQMYLIEIDLGADNDIMRLISTDPDSEQKEAHTRLLHLSFDQSLILKSRVLWERVMNFVYYLETGKNLEVKKKSKKAAFFEFIKDTEWKFLEQYEEYVKWFDDSWRTPEAHKGSKLRARLLSGSMDTDEVNQILGLLGIVTNVFYPNTMSLINGGKPTHFVWVYGMTEEKKLTAGVYVDDLAKES